MIKSPISWERMSYSNIHAFKAKLVTSTMQEWWQMHVYPGGMSQKDHNVCDSVASLAFAERWFSARERERAFYHKGNERSYLYPNCFHAKFLSMTN